MSRSKVFPNSTLLITKVFSPYTVHHGTRESTYSKQISPASALARLQAKGGRGAAGTAKRLGAAPVGAWPGLPQHEQPGKAERTVSHLSQRAVSGIFH